MIQTANYSDELGIEVRRGADELCVVLNFCVYMPVLDEIQLSWNLYQDNQWRVFMQASSPHLAAMDN